MVGSSSARIEKRSRTYKSSSTRKVDVKTTIGIQIISKCWFIICSRFAIHYFLEEEQAQSNT